MTIDRFVVIPTRGYSGDLERLTKTALRENVTPIIVHPNPHAQSWSSIDSPVVPVGEPYKLQFRLDGCINVFRYAQNFQYWANLGFDAAQSAGTSESKTLVINDDILIHPGVFTRLFDEWDEKDYDVVSIDGRPSSAASPMWGWFFGAKAGANRMNTDYVFWWGDDDFWKDSEAKGLRVGVLSGQGVIHSRGNKPGYPKEFEETAKRDELLFASRWLT